jgi:hypothetical protein
MRYVSRWILTGTACWCLLGTSGCILQNEPAAPRTALFAGAWHETLFERALVFGDDGTVVCAGTRCRQIDDTLGVGTWDTNGAHLTLTGVSGRLWWPGGTGLSAGSSVTFAFEITNDADLTLLPVSGSAVAYTRIEHSSAAACTEDTALRLLFPMGGEVFTKGDTIRVRWRASARVPSVVVEFSSDNGISFWNICGKSIVTSVQQWFDWAAEPFDDPADKCYVQIFDYASRDLGSSTSGVFTIK